MVAAVLATLAAAGSGIALWAGPNLDVAVPAAATGVACAVALALLGFARQVRVPKGADVLGEYDSFLLLRSAFQKGLLGRAAIMASIAGLEAELLGPRRNVRSLDEEEALRTASPREFVGWVDGRLNELEAAS
jgi:hypothetical protein